MSDLPTTGDSVAPTALNFNPTDEALGVAVASNIVITFSEAVQLGAGTIVLKNASGTVIETFSLANSGNVSISGDVLTVNPTLNFGFNTGYTVEFAPDSVKDLAGNNYAGTTSYNFTTVSGGNGSPTGAITIVGTPTQGQTLSANTSTLADADGLGSFSYLWQAGGVAIAGANAANYTLTQSEVGKAITVTVSYTDSTGTAESMSSSQTAVVAGSGTTTNAALASFVAEFDNNTQSMVGNVELNGALYVLSTKLISITNFRTDPDGTKSYLTSVVVTKIGNGQVLAQTEVAQLYVGGADSSSNNNSALARGVIGVANGNVKVFFNEKDSGSAYGQNGYSYLLTAQSLTSTASTLFSNANWGWYPRIDSNGDVLHFSYAGYYLYKNTTLQNALQPADAVLPAENQKLVTAGLNGNLTTSISADALSALLISDMKAFVGTTATTLPTYSLAANAASVNEGNNATFTLTTTNLANGTVLPYLLSGTINAADVVGGSLTGNVTVNNNTATITVGLVSDSIIEGVETLTASVTGTAASASTSVTDTATTVTTTGTKAKVFLGANDLFTVSDSNATLFGSASGGTAKLTAGVSGVKTDANFTRIELSGNLTDYKLVGLSGTGLQIQNASGTLVGTIASLNNDITLAYANGSALLRQTGGSAFSLGGLSISTATPATVSATLNAADTSAFSTFASRFTTKSKIFMGQNDSITIVDSGATLIGNTSTTAKIASGVTGVKTDANFNRLELAGSLADYKLGAAAGVGLQIQNASGVTINTFSSLNNDLTLAFANGSALLRQTGGSAFSLGGVSISTGTPATVTTTLNTADTSTLGNTTGSSTVNVSASGSSSAANGDLTFDIASGTYTYTINGFGPGDKLKLFSGAGASVVPDSNDTDGIQSIAFTNPVTAAVTTITLTGLTSAQDEGIFNVSSFNAVFGAGTLA